MMINEMKDSRSSDLLPMFYDCKYFYDFVQCTLYILPTLTLGVRDIISRPGRGRN